MFTIRPASSSDARAIRSLIRKARINPTGLDWHRFLVAVDSTIGIIGCGQVKIHADGSRELASVAVAEGWRGQGIARTIIENLIDNHPQPLYLTCRANLEAFYSKWGFKILTETEMPPHFRRISRIFQVLKTLRLIGEDLLIMERNN